MSKKPHSRTIDSFDAPATCLLAFRRVDGSIAYSIRLNRASVFEHDAPSQDGWFTLSDGGTNLTIDPTDATTNPSGFTLAHFHAFKDLCDTAGGGGGGGSDYELAAADLDGRPLRLNMTLGTFSELDGSPVLDGAVPVVPAGGGGTDYELAMASVDGRLLKISMGTGAVTELNGAAIADGSTPVRFQSGAGAVDGLTQRVVIEDEHRNATLRKNWLTKVGNSQVLTYFGGVDARNPSGNKNVDNIQFVNGGGVVFTQQFTYDAVDDVTLIEVL